MNRGFLSFLLILCMILTMLPVTAMAAPGDYDITYPKKEDYKLGEALDTTGLKVLQENSSGKKVDITKDVTFAVWTREGVIQLAPGEKFILTGTDIVGYNNYTIYLVHMNSIIGVFFANFETPKPTPTPIISPTGAEIKPEGWPFLPADDISGGPVTSGWKKIEANDMTRFRVMDDGSVMVSRYYNNAFYFQNLGNNRYYIRGAYGGYLSYEGKLSKGAKIVISDKPCKWYITTEYWHPITYYFLSPDENHSYYLYSSGLFDGFDSVPNPAREIENSRVIISGASKSERMLKFYIDSSVDEYSVPQWWFDMLDGKTAPKGDLRELDKGDEEAFLYYERLGFKEETKLPATGESINYNMELCGYDVGYNSPYADTVISMLLSKNDRGTYLVAEADGEYVMIYKYASSGEHLGTIPIKYELPAFGAVFSGKKYNYIAFGNKNLKEESSKEVIRIVKYDKEWKRISSVSVTGGKAKTRIPFNATSARFAENGNQLILHTGRERFKSSDGLNHQSNLSVYINTDSMKVTSVSAAFPENHVSHSFDAFVQFDGKTPVFLDHGDGSPRSVILQKESGSSFKKATMYGIKGPKGANWTGVSVGGLEMSAGNYLTVVSATDQSAAKWGKASSDASKNSGMVPSNASSLGRNIIVCVLSKNFKNGASAKTITIAEYRKTKITPLDLQLLKINDDKFAVLWAEYSGKAAEDDYDQIAIDKYIVQYIDGNGSKLGAKKQYKNVKDFYTDYIKEVNSQSNTAGKPAVPDSFTIKKASATSATCTWKAVTGASGYEIYMATSEKGTYEKVGTTTKELKFTKKSLKAGKQYYFKVRAYKTVNGKKVYGSYTKVKSIKL